MSDSLDVQGVRAVLVFADSPVDSCEWWASIFGTTRHEDSGFFWVNLPGGIELGFHPSDETRNPQGRSTVPYWRVEDLDTALEIVITAGATLHRGPLDIDHERRIAQVKDPYGTVFGFDQQNGHAP